MLIYLLVGLALALGVSMYATFLGFARDRAFYTTLLMVIAALYVLFAAIGGSARALATDAFLAIPFVLMASIGFRRNSWLVVVGLAAHGLLDLVHASIVSNAGVPSWWPAFCSTYDVAAAGYLAWTLRRPASLAKPGAQRLS